MILEAWRLGGLEEWMIEGLEDSRPNVMSYTPRRVGGYVSFLDFWLGLVTHALLTSLMENLRWLL